MATRVVTASELAAHASEKGCWMGIRGQVYDVTPFLSMHPGGTAVLLRVAGQDATEHFELAHDDQTLALAAKYHVGVLQDGTYLPPVTQNGTVMENLASQRVRDTIERCHPGDLQQIVNLTEMEQQFVLRAPSSLVLHVNYGAEDDETAKQNKLVWSHFRLVPRFLRDVSRVDMSIELLGHRMTAPLGISPFTTSRACHPEGELLLARGARAQGCCLCAAQFGGTLLEDIARESGVVGDKLGTNLAPKGSPPLLLQLYLPRQVDEDKVDRALVEKMLLHAQRCGCAGVVVTVDTSVDGNRERTYLSTDWMRAVQEQMGGMPPVVTMRSAGVGPFSGHTRGLVWADIAWLCKNPMRLPVFVKGVLAAEDAERCCDPGLGLSGIWVSNHGGRQLDGCEATADALEAVCGAVAGRLPVLVDGGIRRGKDVFRALALGARAVFVGRPMLYGLGLGGQAGVERGLEILRQELERTMILSGCRAVADITRSHVRHALRPVVPGPRLTCTCGPMHCRVQ